MSQRYVLATACDAKLSDVIWIATAVSTRATAENLEQTLRQSRLQRTLRWLRYLEDISLPDSAMNQHKVEKLQEISFNRMKMNDEDADSSTYEDKDADNSVHEDKDAAISVHEDEDADSSVHEDFGRLIFEDIIANHGNESRQDSVVYTITKQACFAILRLFGVLILSLMVNHMLYKEEPHGCQCAIIPKNSNFTEPNATYATLPTYVEMKCDAAGASHCKAICTSLAGIPPTVYWKTICVNQTDDKKHEVLLHYRPCSEDVWQLTETKMTVCCKAGYAHFCGNDADNQQEEEKVEDSADYVTEMWKKLFHF